jgi:hypothetical protein
MGDNNMTDLLTLFHSESQTKTARINGYTVVDQETGQALLGSCLAMAVDCAG